MLQILLFQIRQKIRLDLLIFIRTAAHDLTDCHLAVLNPELLEILIHQFLERFVHQRIRGSDQLLGQGLPVNAGNLRQLLGRGRRF